MQLGTLSAEEIGMKDDFLSRIGVINSRSPQRWRRTIQRHLRGGLDLTSEYGRN